MSEIDTKDTKDSKDKDAEKQLPESEDGTKSSAADGDKKKKKKKAEDQKEEEQHEPLEPEKLPLDSDEIGK